MRKLKLSESPFYLLIILIILLPFNSKIISLLIIITTITSIIFGERKNWKYKFIKTIPFTLPLITLYLWAIASVLWTVNLGVTVTDLEHKLSLIVFPLVIPLIKLNSFRLHFLLKTFVLSCTVVALICLSGTLYKFMFNVPPVDGIDFSKEFSLKDGFGQVHSLFMHRSYYAMYLCISIWYILKTITNRINLKLKKNIVLIFLVLLILVFGVVFSESKTGLITLGFLILLFFIENYKYITKREFLLLLVTIFVFVFLFNNILIEKFKSVYDGFNEPFDVDQVYNVNSTGSRIKLWEASIDLIKRKPILGYGLGTSKETIRSRNLEKKYTVFTIYNRSYNSHNQFLEMWVELGIIGLVLFLMFFIRLVYKNSIFIIGLYSIFIINYFTEVILDRQTGIILVAMFTCFMPIFKNEKQKLKKQNV